MGRTRKYIQVTTYEMVDIATRIRLACTEAGISLSDIAEKLDVNKLSFAKRVENGKFTKEELESIASAIGCKYVCYFKFNGGKTFSAPTIDQQVRDAMNYANMTMDELGKKLGIERQSAAKRLKIGKLTQHNLEMIAGYMNCEYISEFVFPNGTVI